MIAQGQEKLAWEANPRSRKWTPRVHKACPCCGEFFITTTYRISRGMGKYCSWACSNSAKTGRPNTKPGGVTVICQQCGTGFKSIQSRIKNGRGKFCSKACEGEYRSKHYTPWNKGRKWPGMTGENNPAWKGGTATEYELIKGGTEYKLWRKAVVTRDSYTCQGCGSKKNLHAHHILKFSDFPHKRVDISNGVTLCKTCHWKVHSKKETLQ